MKKFFSLIALLCAVVGFTSCNPKNKKSEDAKVCSVTESVYHDYDGVVQDFTAGVSNIQALHRQTMYNTLGVKEYEWRNSQVSFNDTITAENIDSLHITNVNDVFFYWDEKSGPMTQFINSNVKNGVQIPWPINSPWIEDDDLNNTPIKLTAEQAIQRLKEVNCTIPAAKGIILRLPVGPYSCNPQWVIGSINDVLFVDAVTGEVRDHDPAFDKENGGGFKMPWVNGPNSYKF